MNYPQELTQGAVAPALPGCASPVYRWQVLPENNKTG
jgi:hypothetical protein